MWNFIKTKLGRILGTILGLSGAGFFGALAGFAIGAVIDKLHMDGFLIWENDISDYEPVDFILSTLILAAAIVRSDGNVDDKELAFVKNFLSEQYGDSKAEEYFPMFEKLLRKETDIRKTTQHIRIRNNYEIKLQLMYFLFGLANADYNLNEKEIANLKIISIHLGLSAEDFNSVQDLFISETDACYKILELNPGATNAEIKNAYRKLVNKYHPDKISHIGNLQFIAVEKFQKIREAYTKLKTIKGIN